MRSRRAIILSAVLFLPAIGAFAVPTPEFAGIPWGSSDATVKHVMAERGFTFSKKDDDGDLDFKGDINGRSVVIYEMMTPSRHLVKAQVIFETPDDEAISFYGDFKQTLVGKYGDPSHSFAFYSYPYTDDDPESQHETAIAVGKGDFASFWDFDNQGGIWIQITKKLAVQANYESAGWHAEVTRRKSNGNSVF